MGKDDAYAGPFKNQDGSKLVFKPDTGEYILVNDVREKWKHGAEDFRTTKAERQAFYQQRIQLIETSQGRDELRQELLANLNESVKDEEAGPDDLDDFQPVPGGVGYGAYYRSGQLRFTDSSVLYYKIVTIPEVGNVNNNWLYLTSTNRAPKGVEAYVAYRQQDTPMFKVFDWSKTGQDRFALSRPYDWLDDYLIPHEEEGDLEFQTLYVANSTRRTSDTHWINEVMLYNPNTDKYDLVYSHAYDLATIDEKKYLWWGPIVETFPPFPFTINSLGFFDAQLLQDESPPVMLTNDVTELKTDHAGVQVVFARANYSFIVHW
jgi:hypothetical protein